MQHNEHLASVQRLVIPLSPMLHFRRVPCHRRFSFPRDFPADAKFPLASTVSLQSGDPVNQGQVGRESQSDVQVLFVSSLVRRGVDDFVNCPDFGTRRGVPPGLLKLCRDCVMVSLPSQPLERRH